MDPATIALLGQLAQLAFQVVDGGVRVKAALDAEDAAEIERLLAESAARRNNIADELRAAGPAPED